MKTICFVVTDFPVKSQTFVINQILHAKSQGYNTIILARRLHPISESLQQNLLIQNKVLDNAYVIDYNIPKHKIKKLFYALFLTVKFLKYLFRLKKTSKKERFLIYPFVLNFYDKYKKNSVFHVQFANAGIELANLKAIGFIKNKIITTFHGLDAHYVDDKNLKELQYAYRDILKHSDYLTVNSSYVAQKVIKLGGLPHKLKIIPMFINTDIFCSSSMKKTVWQNTVKLISVGRLIELKGFNYAIRSVKELLARGFEIKYTIVGEGEHYAELQQLIKKLNLSKNVCLVGYKSQNEIKCILEDHHIYLMSSITDKTNRAEAQGLVTAEAQAMGLPVVAFDCGGVSSTIVNNRTGLLVPEKDIKAFTRALISLISNKKLYKAMSLNAREFVLNNLSEYHYGKEMDKLYR